MGNSASEGKLVVASGGAMEQYRQRAETRLSVIEVSKIEVTKMATSLSSYMMPGENPVENYEKAVALAPKTEDFKEESPGWVVATAVLAEH